MNDLIVPGSYVMHPKKKSWGIGQVQSKIKGIITINFENCGKKTINGEKIDLIIVKNE
tara:strand:+ start:433 stop:606 length:174 start_codon:yes stop_codon:yes gene_type:complete